MDSRLVEEKLVLSIVTNNYDIDINDVLGLYIWGSRLWKTDDIISDLDYVVIVNSTISRKYLDFHTTCLDITILTEIEYISLLNKCDDMALSLYYQKDPLIEYKTKKGIFDKENILQELRRSFSSKANNSYVKAKKKLIIEEDIKLASKSMFHSLRLLEMGSLIARNITNGSSFNIEDYITKISYNDILNDFIKYSNDWDSLHSKYKPLYNKLSSEFKLLAPKG